MEARTCPSWPGSDDNQPYEIIRALAIPGPTRPIGPSAVLLAIRCSATCRYRLHYSAVPNETTLKQSNRTMGTFWVDGRPRAYCALPLSNIPFDAEWKGFILIKTLLSD